MAVLNREQYDVHIRNVLRSLVGEAAAARLADCQYPKTAEEASREIDARGCGVVKLPPGSYTAAEVDTMITALAAQQNDGLLRFVAEEVEFQFPEDADDD